jgi:hypothetical protein
MVERMSNAERVELLMAILDRVMSNLSEAERGDLAARVAGKLSAPAASIATTTTTDSDPMIGVGGPARGEDETAP